MSKCYTYTIRNGDTCAKIAEGYRITTANIEAWNANTSAWYGCNDLQDGGQVCLSAGDPPMPVAIGNAVCGPQVPGTERPKDILKIPSLNPCPAGQCCSRNGQCGTGAGFCDSSALTPSVSAAPADKAAPASATTKATSAPAESAKQAAPASTTTKTTSAPAESAKQAAPASTTTKTTSAPAESAKQAAPASTTTKTTSALAESAKQAAPASTTTKTTSALAESAKQAAPASTTTKTTSAPAPSVRTEATPVENNAALIAKSLSNKDPNFFTTDIPLIDVPLTFLHSTTTVPSYPLVSVDKIGNAIKMINMFATIGQTSTTTTTTMYTTTSKPSTTATTSSTTNSNPTKVVDGIATVPSGWELRMFDEPGCAGNYVLLQGHNKYLEDSSCMKFRSASELSTNVTDTSVSCRWWTIPESGNWNWRDCHSTALDKPKSWKMSNGLCTVSPNTKCDLVNDISQTYGWRGPGVCQDRQTMDPKFVSMKCYVG
ncbi:Peptidoglycan-binding Lysin subgroup [Penicillium vulpinum]|uniref:Peptidoglycan-binding Lysin subgroup n=1 Tax=Penicillium vulpinum TaxID=29845 RepID=UPI0025479A8E|nr:Peptidoglycan-binding Lysin subgroup [Penicillium vulpinum]KAJ5970521.1 Peptidoglycan-binding Lysin subgroup [Penicillium vulpinum]